MDIFLLLACHQEGFHGHYVSQNLGQVERNIQVVQF